MRSRPLRSMLATPALVLGLAVAAVPVPAAAAPVADTGCVVQDATITWGFKESFRSYISGAIANGQWSVAGGAQYETPNFSFSRGTGRFEPGGRSGLVEFPGSIRFTGHGGVLDTTIAQPAVRFEAEHAILVADVTGTTQDGSEVDERAIDFVRLDLSDAASSDRSPGAATITGVPATLTDAGAAAFGTYRAGEPFDPVTLELDFAGDCAVPAEAGAWVPWAVGGVLAAGAATAVILFRRRVRVTPPPLE